MPASEVSQLSDDEDAQITIMGCVLSDEMLLKGEESALLALHRHRFPTGDITRFGAAAIIRAATHRNMLAVVLAGQLVVAESAAAHTVALAAEIAPPSHSCYISTFARGVLLRAQIPAADIEHFLPEAMRWADLARSVAKPGARA